MRRFIISAIKSQILVSNKSGNRQSIINFYFLIILFSYAIFILLNYVYYEIALYVILNDRMHDNLLNEILLAVSFLKNEGESILLLILLISILSIDFLTF